MSARCDSCRITKLLLIMYKDHTFCLACWPQFLAYSDLHELLTKWLAINMPDQWAKNAR